MESSTPKTRESSTRKRRATQTSLTYTTSSSAPNHSPLTPTPQSNKKKKEKRKEKKKEEVEKEIEEAETAEEEVYWETKFQAILAQKLVDGKVWYLFNWANDRKTGEAYPPSWEPAANATKPAKSQWAAQKTSGEVVRQGPKDSFILKQASNDDETETTGAKKRKRDQQVARVPELQPQIRADAQEPLPKRHRQGRQADTPEVQDSYGQEDTPSTPVLHTRRNGEVVVELEVPDDFDRSAYQPIRASQTGILTASSHAQLQSQLGSSPASSEQLGLEDPEDVIETSSPSVAGPPRTFVTDRFVVPDSQDQILASEAWEPSQGRTLSTVDTSPFETEVEEDSGLVEHTQQNADSVLLADSEQESETSQIEVETVDNSLNDDIYQNDNSQHLNITRENQSGQARGNNDTVDSSIVEITSSAAQVKKPENSAPERASDPTGPSQDVSSVVPDSITSQHVDVSLVQSLLTPTRQIQSPQYEQPHYEHSSSPSSQILLGSTRGSQPNSSNPSQTQLLSPDAERSRANTPNNAPKSLAQSSPAVHSGAQIVPHSDSEEHNQNSPEQHLQPCREAAGVDSLQHSITTSAEEDYVPSGEAFGTRASLKGVDSLQATTTSRATSPSAKFYTRRQVIATPSSAHLPERELADFTHTSAQRSSDSPYPPESRVYQSIEVSDCIVEHARRRTTPFSQFGSQRSSMDSEAETERAKLVAQRAAKRTAESMERLEKLYAKRQQNARIANRKTTLEAETPPIIPGQADTTLSASLIANNPIEVTLQEAVRWSPAINEPRTPLVAPSEVTTHEAVPEIEHLDIEAEESEFDVVPGTSDEYFIALPMNAGCREVYHQTLKSARMDRAEFMALEEYNEAATAKMTNMISALELLCSHPDLHSDDYSTQRMDSVITQAKLAENRSTKCIFVAELLQEMRSQRKHVAIVARPGRMLEILRAVVEYHEFSPRTSSNYEYQYQDSLVVYLIPSDGSVRPNVAADLTIAFDSTFSNQPHIHSSRKKQGSESFTPLIHLVIPQSVEHLQALFSEDIPPDDRLLRIVGCLSLIKDNVGKDIADPMHVAKDISNFVARGGNSLEWPCENLPIVDSAQGYSEDMQSSSSPTAHYRTAAPSTAVDSSAVQFSTINKRHLDEEDAMSVESTKRQRLTPLSGDDELSLPHAASHINDHHRSQPLSNLFNGVRGPSQAGLRLEQENSKSKQQLRGTDEVAAGILRLNADLQGQVVDLQESIKSMQPKYQDAINDRAKYELEGKLAVAAAQRLKKNLDAQQEEIVKLKAQSSALAQELSEAREIMASSTVPDINRLARLEERVKQLEADKMKLENQKQNASNDLNFMQERYQSASSSAAESATANSALQEEITVLREAASANKIRIHEIQHDQEKAGYLRMVKQLKIETTELRRELEKRSNELATAMNGRRATRGTSTPKSPRLSSPAGGMYTNTVNRGNLGRILQQQQARSRGNSPAVVDRGMGNGPTGFGEFLPGNKFADGPRRG